MCLYQTEFYLWILNFGSSSLFDSSRDFCKVPMLSICSAAALQPHNVCTSVCKGFITSPLSGKVTLIKRNRPPELLKKGLWISAALPGGSLGGDSVYARFMWAGHLWCPGLSAMAMRGWMCLGCTHGSESWLKLLCYTTEAIDDICFTCFL